MGSTDRAPAFNKWLQAQLKARRLTQRQLAHKSGVDHSTVSRLIRGERVPSLRTAAMLARGLGLPDHFGRQDRLLGAGSSPTARVEYALRSDEALDEPWVRRIMDMYLTERLASASRAQGESGHKASAKTPVAIVRSVGGVGHAARNGPTPAARVRNQQTT